MFAAGDYISYGRNGVCLVEGVTEMFAPGSKQKKSYYVLTPVYGANSTIYCPVEVGKGLSRRPILTRDEAGALVSDMKNADMIEAPARKSFDEKCKSALASGECRAWVSVIKTMYSEMQHRAKMGKKMTATNEHYLKAALENLCGELAVALERGKEEMEGLVKEVFTV